MENRRVIIQIGITILLLSILGWLLLNAEVIMDRQAQRSANDLAVLSERVQSRMAQLSASNRSLYQTSAICILRLEINNFAVQTA